MSGLSLSEDDDLLAAEVALRLVGSGDVPPQLAASSAFTQRVVWWEERFAGLADSFGSEPPADLWPRIAARVPQNDNRRTLLVWKMASGALAAVAAAALIFAVQRPAADRQGVPPAPMVAALAGEGGAALSISFDAGSKRVTVAPIRLERSGKSAELWVIPAATGKPVSLGIIDDGQAVTRSLPEDKAGLMAEGATLAVSLEPAGGSPSGAPTGPVIASGKLTAT